MNSKKPHTTTIAAKKTASARFESEVIASLVMRRSFVQMGNGRCKHCVKAAAGYPSSRTPARRIVDACFTRRPCTKPGQAQSTKPHPSPGIARPHSHVESPQQSVHAFGTERSDLGGPDRGM